MTPQEKARDKRLRKSYGWTLEMVNELSRIQDGKCGACGRKPKDGGAPLNVDHQHPHIRAYRRTKFTELIEITSGGIQVLSAPPSEIKWFGCVFEMPDILTWGKTKAEALRLAREIALPRSVRGLLCAGRHRGCNRLLGRIDDPVLLRQFLNYLENPPARKMIQNKSEPKKEAA